MTNYKSIVNNIATSVKLHMIILYGFHLFRMVPNMIDSWFLQMYSDFKTQNKSILFFAMTFRIYEAPKIFFLVFSRIWWNFNLLIYYRKK